MTDDHARDAGAPTTVVLVHHAAGGASDWRELRERLEPGVEVWAPDFPGHGALLHERPLETIDAMVEWLAGRMRERSIVRAVVAGHSMGGAVALRLALQHPELVGGLALVSTGARLRVARALLQLVREHFSELPQRMVSLGFSPSADPEVVRRWVEGPWPATPAAAVADFAACDGFDVRSRLSEVRVPAVVMVGEDDVMTPPKLSRELAAGIAGARLRVFPSCGHLLLWERPAELAEEIRRLCAVAGGGPGRGDG
ncbi:MAG: alpha/beta fold hydrolase [Myxococcales bacterium]|nr:alpha/beta fold hydrolase [Myxococcales bacterium]